MIESIVITSLSEAVSNSFKSCKQNAWLSLVDVEDKNKIRLIKSNFSKKGVVHFAQYFYDWSDEDEESFIRSRISLDGPLQQHANNIIHFLKPLVESTKTFHLGINCYAGISRSTAAGIIAWTLQGNAPIEAFEKILVVRPQAWPNLRLLRLASNTLGVDLLNPIKQWKEVNKTKLFML